jgi:glycine dehydrogenase subunit 1
MNNAFAHPYLPTTTAQRKAMLEKIGADSEDDLFQDLPKTHVNPEMNLPPPLSEMQLRSELSSIASRNITPGDYPCFLGAGAYRHFIPSVVNAIISRGEFLTSYTPYQPEVSQGTLQATYDFQSLICLLTEMDIANAGMYDGATALAEAALMACRVSGRTRILALSSINPRYREVVSTYVTPQGLTFETCSQEELNVDHNTACVLVQSPNFFGSIITLDKLAGLTHSVGALLVASIDPISLGLFNPPGQQDVDIVVGECQSLGSPLTFGGPFVGLFACKQKFIRQMPGRIVGKTSDDFGRTGFVLTLQTREQHIRRQRATSNICTSEALISTSAAVYLAALGPKGLRSVAELCYHKAHYAANLIDAIPGFSVLSQNVWFNEFVVESPLPPKSLNEILLKHKIIGGLDISEFVPNGVLFAVTEMNSRDEIDGLVEVLKQEVP